jgi:hypothetical protein
MEFVSMMIGQKLISDTISTTTSGIYYLLGQPSLNQSSLKQCFLQMDIENKCKCVEMMCKEIEAKEYESKAIECCLHSVHEMLSNIQSELQQIEIKVKEHPQKWFCNFRSYDILKELDSLKYHIQSLDSRVDLLCKNVSIYSR